MQLAAFSKNHFSLGLAAVFVNEGLPQFMVDQLAGMRPLNGATVGLLGMAFKAETDDIRDSLSYKLRKLLHLEGARVLCHDPYVRDPDLVPLDRVLRETDALVVATPHREYAHLEVPEGKVVVDVWNLLRRKAAPNPEHRT